MKNDVVWAKQIIAGALGVAIGSALTLLFGDALGWGVVIFALVAAFSCYLVVAREAWREGK